jgi:very-short-patch-repair endonuclease
VAADLPGSLQELARFQRGVLTRKQALSGLSLAALHWRLQNRQWQRLYPGTYAVFTGEPSRPTRLWTAVLYAGDGAMLSHHTAAELSGLIRQPGSLIHVTIPVYRRVRPADGLVIHMSARASQARHPALAPPRSRIEETVLDLVQVSATPEDAYGWVTRALGGRFTTRPRLEDALSLRPRTRWRAELNAAISTDFDGIHSVLEHRYVRDVEGRHRLPRGQRQVRVRHGGRTEYRDILYAEYGVAVELDGWASHPADMRWGDIQRDNRAAAAGLVTLRFGWLDVTRRPCRVASQVAGTLRQRGPVQARPCSPGCPVPATA